MAPKRFTCRRVVMPIGGMPAAGAGQGFSLGAMSGTAPLPAGWRKSH